MAVVKRLTCNKDNAEKIFHKLLEEGFRYPRVRNNKLYIYNNENDSVCITPEGDIDAKELLNLFKTLRQSEEQSYEEGRSGKSNVGKRYTLEALDRSHAKIVRNIAETVSWFTDVLHDIGFYATIIAMQHAKVPPEQLYNKIKEFKDPKEFVNFVKDHLVALLEAKEDANLITQLKEKLDLMDTKLLLLKECYNRIKSQRDELILMLHTATSCMCDDCLKRFLLSYMSTKYGISLAGGGTGGGSSSQAGSGEERNIEGGSSSSA